MDPAIDLFLPDGRSTLSADSGPSPCIAVPIDGVLLLEVLFGDFEENEGTRAIPDDFTVTG